MTARRLSKRPVGRHGLQRFTLRLLKLIYFHISRVLHFSQLLCPYCLLLYLQIQQFFNFLVQLAVVFLFALVQSAVNESTDSAIRRLSLDVVNRIGHLLVAHAYLTSPANLGLVLAPTELYGLHRGKVASRSSWLVNEAWSLFGRRSLSLHVMHRWLCLTHTGALTVRIFGLEEHLVALQLGHLLGQVLSWLNLACSMRLVTTRRFLAVFQVVQLVAQCLLVATGRSKDLFLSLRIRLGPQGRRHVLVETWQGAAAAILASHLVRLILLLHNCQLLVRHRDIRQDLAFIMMPKLSYISTVFYGLVEVHWHSRRLSQL